MKVNNVKKRAHQIDPNIIARKDDIGLARGKTH